MTNSARPKFDEDVARDEILATGRVIDTPVEASPLPGGLSTTSKASAPPRARPAKKERRRRVDPTTFEKEYTEAEIEFMNAMQQFKNQSGHVHPTSAEVLKVAARLGYRKFNIP